jgi:2-oxoisovalerate dehydrogenase E1 component
LFWSALQDQDPSLILIPKHLLRVRAPAQRYETVPWGRAALRQSGSDVTVVSWGNCLELAEQAARKMAQEGVSIELIDLRTLVPCDWATVERSVVKTGRLVVVTEDCSTCSFGQAVVARLATSPQCFDALVAPLQLVARPDVHIPYSPALEHAVLPDLQGVLNAIQCTLR